MKRYIKLIILTTVFLIIINILQITSFATNKVIVLDPGHGRTRYRSN